MNLRKVLAIFLLAPALLAPGAYSLGTPRHGHTSTLLPDGNILITGGTTDAGGGVTANVEMYNMATNTYQAWSSNLATARSSHTATLMSDGRILIAGGFAANGQPMTSLEICNPVTKLCAAPGFGDTTMLTARGGHTATLLSKGANAGRVLLCGGRTGTTGTSITEACEIFDPVAQTRAAAGPMISPREGHAATLLITGKVFATGGRRRNPADSAWIYEPMNEMYDPTTGVWTPVSALLQGRINHTATVLNNGKIMIAGGYNANNYAYCQSTDPEALEDECWHLKYDTNWAQDFGNHGYLDGAEFFDQNGARVVLSEETYGEIPYRVAGHSAVLLPDGRWKMQGGYGGIVPTFFKTTPVLEDDSIIYLTATGNHTATINASSIIKFPLMFPLSRPVSGRLVDADVFISPNEDPLEPSIEQDTVQFFIANSTAVADASPVGLLIPDSEPGTFDSILQLQNPGGSAIFEKEQAASGQAAPTLVTVSGLNLSADLYPAETDGVITGNLTAEVSFTLPDSYSNIVGVANLKSGTIIDPDYTIQLGESGSGAFNIPNPISCDADEDTCIYFSTIAFTGVTGTMANLTTLENGTTFYVADNPVPAAGTPVQLTFELDYIAQQVSILDREPDYNFDRSTMVIRGMVFSSQLGYSPDVNKWADLSDKEESPAMFEPAFNHTALLTPAADTVIAGGRNCEATPAADCLRGVMNFLPSGSGTIFIPVFRSAAGSLSWPNGNPLITKRAFHTSTLLPDGSILTCGGSDGAKQLSSCELLNPVTKEWEATGSMNSPRANHTATLLPNGNVFATGGIIPGGTAVNTSEIYYPATRRWVAAASMTDARQLHTATLMPDGNVLIAGGATLSTYTVTAEVYISSTNIWISAGSMTNGRSQHTATLLKNGNILMAGGINGLGAMKSSEIFNYLTRTFSAGPDLNTARYAHTANQLRDGNVIVTGGSDNIEGMKSCEVYTVGGTWTAVPETLNFNRANHRSVLLPNGKLMLTGGEMRGTAQSVPEGFDPDYRSWSEQGTASGRTHHTSLMTKDNMLMTIGGWSGGKYLDTTEIVNFNYSPDINGLEADTTRQAIISTGTVYFNTGGIATLLSGTSNFHGITEASGGGAGPANSSFHNPRVYMQQIDNPSGFMIDLSTRIYSAYGGPNTDWEATLSSITIITPDLPGVMPHGWYHMRTAAAGVFSNGHTVQVTVPRPTGLASAPTGTVLGISSITWAWNSGTIASADGYNMYSATDSVFITTVSFTPLVSHTQTGLPPNTAASIMVSAYNLGGNGPLSKSVTYYTLAAVPTPLIVQNASFETAALEWARNANSELTIYEVSMSAVKTPKFSDALAISTPVPFSVNYTSTSTVINQLSANQMYDFRVRARNGAGIVTDFSNYVTTITVSGVNNFTGQALSSSTINWSWDSAVGATYYELYDVTDGTAAAVFIGSTTESNLSQTNLSANFRYTAMVNAVNDTSGYGPIRGPLLTAAPVYTLTVQPLPATPNVFTNISTGSFTANWITNGNSTWTVYGVKLSTAGVLASSYTTTENSITFSPLSPNMQHVVTLTAINGDGIEGTAIELGSKYTLAKVPAALIALDVNMSGIVLGWDTVDNSTETIYELRSSTSDVFADPIVKHIYFSQLYTDNYALASGLQTATTYYFDIAACNGEGVALNCTGVGVTARKRSAAVSTLPGPGGAPSGSVGGTSDPTKTVSIDGHLPNNRRVIMTLPAGSFPAPTAIAISSSTTNSCGYLPGGTPVEVAIYSENQSQPQEPITLTFSFGTNSIFGAGTGPDASATQNAIIADASKLVLARYNPDSGQCLPLETKVNIGDRTITATLNHFSLFQLMTRTAASNLNNVLIYPNPFYTNRGQGFVTIDKIPAGSKVRIYTLSGDKVWEATAGSTGVIIWRATNKSGNLVASGIYLVVIDSSSGKKVFKVAVER